MSLKKSIVIIGIGLLNVLHASLHIIQFLQSVLLVKESMGHKDESTIDSVLHSPVFAIIWGLIGLSTLWMGIKDFRHHRKCHKHESI